MSVLFLLAFRAGLWYTGNAVRRLAMKGESRKQNYKKSRKRPPLIQRIKVPLFVLAGLLLVSAGAYGLQKMLPAQTGVTDPAEISTEVLASSS